MRKMKDARVYQLLTILSCIALILIFTSAHAQEGLVPTSASRLTGVSLPAGAHQVTDRTMLAQINIQLKTFADELKSKCVDSEVLGWTPERPTPEAVQTTIQRFAAELKAAGWGYEDQNAGAEAENSLKVVAVTKQDQIIGGFWIISDDALLLAWCRLASTTSAPRQKVEPAPTAAPAGSRVSNALEGLYVGYYESHRPASERYNLTRVGTDHKAHIIFFPDGSYYWRLPNEGFANFNRAEHQKDFSRDWGTYTNDGQKVRIMAPWAHMIAPWTKQGLKLQERFYKRVCSCDGMRISGTYHRPGWEEVDARVADNYLTFYPDGRFEEKDLIKAAGIEADWYHLKVQGITEPTEGSGTYSIYRNTLELRYSNGYVKRTAFYVHEDDVNKKSPDPVVIGILARWFHLRKP
jgi:hypothetical protein